jgi:methylglyoxal synthase
MESSPQNGHEMHFERPVVALLVSPSRQSEDLVEFLDHELLPDISNYSVVTTGDTHDFLHRCGLTKRYPNLVRVRYALEGGVVEIANLVVYGICKDVIRLTGHEDPFASSPEDKALVRVCEGAHARLLLNDFAARLWAQSPSRAKAIPPARTSIPSKGDPNVDRFGRVFATNGTFPPSSWTAALVAHDSKKEDMIEFCRAGADRLKKFKRLIGTEGTARRIHEKTGLEVEPVGHGPSGGDVAIAYEVLRHRCHAVIFFVDPATAHPHIEDITTLLRSLQYPGVHADAVFDLQTAEPWIHDIFP